MLIINGTGSGDRVKKPSKNRAMEWVHFLKVQKNPKRRIFPRTSQGFPGMHPQVEFNEKFILSNVLLNIV